MADFPLALAGKGASTKGLAASTSLTTVTSGAGGAPGAWTQIIASQHADVLGFILQVGKPQNSDLTVIDVAEGAAAAEQVIASKLFFYNNAAANLGDRYLIPIPLRAGTRYSARVTSSANGKDIGVGIVPLEMGFFGVPMCASMSVGGLSGTTLTTITSPINNAESAWTEMITSAAKDARFLTVVGERGGSSNTDRHEFDVGIGAAGSEQVVIPNIPYFVSDSNSWARNFGPFPVAIPAGSRVSMRVRNVGSTAARLEQRWGLYLFH